MKRSDIYNMFKREYCQACGCNGAFNALTIDHIKTRGSGGSDEEYNCMTLCLSCHIEKGQKGVSHMAKRYPSYYEFLIEYGWKFDSFLKKWVSYDSY